MNAPHKNIEQVNLCDLQLFNGDARNVASYIENKTINLTITSPPYFNLKDYGADNQIGFGQSYEAYLNDLKLVFSQIHSNTANDGSLWVVIDTFRKDGELVALPFDLAAKLKEVGWQLHDIIVWKKDRTLPWLHSGSTRNIFEYVLVFSKAGHKIKYYPDRVREHTDLKKWWVRYPERYSPKGKALEEVWNIDIPTQGSWGKDTPRHFCPLPPPLVRRIIKLSSDVNDVILDPFAGTGVVLTEAISLGRTAFGCELNKDLVDDFYSRDIRCSQKIDNDSAVAEEFETINLNLRILKLARQILKAIKKDLGVSSAQIYVEKSKENPKTKFGIVCANYSLILNEEVDGREGSFLNYIQQLISKPPLSKFGVEVNLTLLPSAERVDWPGENLYLYTLTNTHKYKELLPPGNIPGRKLAVISPIFLNVGEPNE